MRCVVLGGTGFIGLHLVSRLWHQGHQVTVLGRHRPIDPLKGVQYLQGDWNTTGVLEEAVAGAEVVYHLIWNGVPLTLADDFQKDIEENVLRSLEIFRLCLAAKVKQVIFCSSGGTVYGIADHIPIHEEHPLRPISSYGLTKMMVENYLRLFQRKYDLPFIIVRPSNAYGQGQNADGLQGVVARFLWCAKNQQPVVLYGDGKIVRDYILVDEVAEALARLATYTGKERVFNIGSGQGTSLSELVTLVEEFTHHKLTITYEPIRWFDVPQNVLDVSKLHTELGWQPKTSLMESLAHLVK